MDADQGHQGAAARAGDPLNHRHGGGLRGPAGLVLHPCAVLRLRDVDPEEPGATLPVHAARAEVAAGLPLADQVGADTGELSGLRGGQLIVEQVDVLHVLDVRRHAYPLDMRKPRLPVAGDDGASDEDTALLFSQS